MCSSGEEVALYDGGYALAIQEVITRKGVIDTIRDGDTVLLAFGSMVVLTI